MIKRNFLSYICLFLAFALSFAPIYLIRDNLGSDDSSYFSHAMTIGLDFDLDYSNEPAYNQSMNIFKNLPSHPIGAGLVAAPFVSLFSIVDRIFGHPIINDHSKFQFSWSFFGFMFAANFCFFLGVLFYWDGIKDLFREYTLSMHALLIGSTGILYYVLARFTMAHAFEFAALSVAFWTGIKLYRADRLSMIIIWALLSSVAVMLNLAIRISNLNTIFLTQTIFLWIGTVEKDKQILGNKQNIFKLKLLTIASIVGCMPIILFNYYFYDMPYPNLAVTHGFGNNLVDDGTIINKAIHLADSIPNVAKIIFSSEFGLLYSNPALVFGSLILFFYIVKNIRVSPDILNFTSAALILGYLSFSWCIVLIVPWHPSGNSYGYRYLYPLFPVSILGIIQFLKRNRSTRFKNHSYVKKFVYVMFVILGIYALMGQIFFDVNEQLSSSRRRNVFGDIKNSSASGYNIHLAHNIINPKTWFYLVAKRFPGLIISPIFSIQEFYSRLPRTVMERYNTHYRGLPPAVYFQALFLCITWLAFGVCLNKLDSRRTFSQSR